MDASEIVAAVHRRDELLREADILIRLTKDLNAGSVRLGSQDEYGLSEEKRFQPLPSTQQERIVELAREHAGEIRAEAERIMQALEGKK